MKRCLVWMFFVLLISFGLIACGNKSGTAKGKDVVKADEAILSIGKVSLESEDAIRYAEELVGGLGEKDYDKLENIWELKQARKKYDTLVIENAIEEIGEVTFGKEDLINSARKKYDEASDNVKDAVTNYKALEDAEKVLKSKNSKLRKIENSIGDIGKVGLKSEESIKYARKIYDAADEDVKKEVTNYAVLVSAEKEFERLRVDSVIKPVEEAINNIGVVSIDSKEAIDIAKRKYNELSRQDKGLVGNYNVLQNAVTAYNSEIEKEYNKVKSRIKITSDEVVGTTYYMPKTMSEYVNVRVQVLPYMCQSGKSKYFYIRYNYAGRKWVFFKKVTIVVDGEKYYKKFDYFDIYHGNNGGMVGEEIDDVISISAEGEGDFEMLRKIAKSQKTIVRFEGDSDYYDYTMTKEDKSAIRDMLILYEYFNK